jgi:hypothetical protein
MLWETEKPDAKSARPASKMPLSGQSGLHGGNNTVRPKVPSHKRGRINLRRGGSEQDSMYYTLDEKTENTNSSDPSPISRGCGNPNGSFKLKMNRLHPLPFPNHPPFTAFPTYDSY